MDETKIEFVGVRYEPNCSHLRPYCSRIICNIHFKPNTEYYPIEVFKTIVVLNDRQNFVHGICDLAEHLARLIVGSGGVLNV